jgi:hypothetical protein
MILVLLLLWRDPEGSVLQTLDAFLLCEQFFMSRRFASVGFS